ncbi:MAG: ABC transporter permease [Cryomorphaceae bacterium]|nr:MAG: ABC transporter permease [Cryomorphaceae bacterium]
MAWRTLKRLLYWFPGLFLVCLLGFVLIQVSPGDPVLARLNLAPHAGSAHESIYETSAYQTTRVALGLDRPPFYLSATPSTVPDTLGAIAHPGRRKALKALSMRLGGSEKVLDWYHTHNELRIHLAKSESAMVQRLASDILLQSNLQEILRRYQLLSEGCEKAENTALVMKVAVVAAKLNENQQSWKSFIPVFQWHGIDNQFHRWLLGHKGEGGLIRGDFGRSYRDNQPVAPILANAFSQTLLLAVAAWLLMFVVAVPAGLKLAQIDSPGKSRFWLYLLLVLYSIPGYWLGTLMLTFLCSPDFLNWFPVAYKLMDIPENASWFSRQLIIMYHLILPVTCWTAAGAAFIAIQTRKEARAIMRSRGYLGAKSRGLSEKQLMTNHVAPRALIPAIGWLGGLIPASLSGAVAIELIFSINGMGNLAFQSFHARDYPVVMAIIFIAALTTLIGTVVSDILLHYIDPRTREMATK